MKGDVTLITIGYVNNYKKKKKKIVKNVDFLALLDIKSILSKREREREGERPDKVLTPLKQVLRKVVPLPGCSNCGSWFWLSTPSAPRYSIIFCPLYKVLVHL